MSKDFDTAPVRNKSDSRTLVKVPQPLTVVEGQTSDGTLYVIPDTPAGYGDEKSVVAMTEDVVGRHTGSDIEAKQAGNVAGEQYNTDIRQRMLEIRQQQYFSKYPAGYHYVHRDNAGVVTGVTLLLSVWNSETQQTEIEEISYDSQSLLGHAISTGQNNLIDEALGSQ